jgi:hypothetical protein
MINLNKQNNCIILILIHYSALIGKNQKLQFGGKFILKLSCNSMLSAHYWRLEREGEKSKTSQLENSKVNKKIKIH